LSAKILLPDCYGKLRIRFSQRILIKGINKSDINSSNTEIKILPYHDKRNGEFLNLSNYNLTWNTTNLTEEELEILLDFENPD
jgi:hypothetical protein